MKRSRQGTPRYISIYLENSNMNWWCHLVEFQAFSIKVNFHLQPSLFIQWSLVRSFVQDYVSISFVWHTSLWIERLSLIFKSYFQELFSYVLIENISNEGQFVFERNVYNKGWIIFGKQDKTPALFPLLDGDTGQTNCRNHTKCMLYFLAQLDVYTYILVHGLRTPNEGINQRNLKIRADPANKICCRHT